jgi:kynureninase
VDEPEALRLDAEDPLAARRDEFAVPPWPGGRLRDSAYLAGNSLGLMPHAARGAVGRELDIWARLGVEGWFEGERAWLEEAERLAALTAPLVGAASHEVAVMNTLTVNLHLLLASFYRPTSDRHVILIEDGAFPSDSYAVQTRVAMHGHDASRAVVRVRPREGEATFRTADVVAAIDRVGGALAVALLPGVSYLTGERLDIPTITGAVRRAGGVAAWDLAHAVGNVPLALHDWDVDVAVWCTYKYLNAGPGAPGGAFVHERHAAPDRLRLAGWWGTDPRERFRMEPDFVARPGAAGFAVSTPSIVALAPLSASLDLFATVGMEPLRERSVRLTGYLERLLEEVAADRRDLRLLTPRDADARGCQLSLALPGARELARRLRAEHGVICDVREPDVVRLAPAPLYNTFHDCWRAARALLELTEPR